MHYLFFATIISNILFLSFYEPTDCKKKFKI